MVRSAPFERVSNHARFCRGFLRETEIEALAEHLSRREREREGEGLRAIRLSHPQTLPLSHPRA
jgi:hypothetical protein